MINNENVDFLIQLLDDELEQEFNYRVDSDKDTTYIKKCIKAKKWLYDNNNGGFIESFILQDDTRKYIDGLEKEKEV